MRALAGASYANCLAWGSLARFGGTSLPARVAEVEDGVKIGEPSAPPHQASVLEVAVSRGEGGEYQTEARSLAGEAHAVANLDVKSLGARREELRYTVLTSAVLTELAPSEGELALREVGRQLFAGSVGAGAVAELYRASEALAARRGQQLRVVIRVRDPVLAGLPWEAMYDEVSGAYVCRRHHLIRHVGVVSPAAPLLVDLPLRILAVASSPAALGALDAAAEKRQLARALSPLTGQRQAELVWAPSATWADLHETLLAGQWHVLHFIGHGRYGPSPGEGALALTRDNREADWVEASRLVDLVRMARPIPPLVVLNSCSGATLGPADMFSGTATALVRGGVSAVAAMQYELSDPAALAFSRGFYSALAQGRGVDEAVSSGRVSILGISRRTLEWVTPVLYLRGDNSRLFTVQGPPSGAPAAPDKIRAARPPRTLSRHSAGLRCLAFSPSGSLLASAGDEPGVQLWQVPEGASTRMIPARPRPVTSLAFSPDERLLVSAGQAARFVWLWETATGKRVRQLAAHTAGVFGIALSAGGDWLASASADQTARLWTLPAGEPVRTLSGHAGTVWSVAFSPDGRWLASGGADQTVRVWTLPSGEPARTLRGPGQAVTCLAVSPSQSLLAAAAGTAVYLWDPATGTPKGTLAARGELVYSVAFSPRGHLLVSAGADGLLRLWDVSTGEEVQQLAGHDGAVTDVKFSPDSTLLASAGSDHTLRLWEMPQ